MTYSDQHERRPVGSGSAGSASPACWSSSRRSPRPSATSRRRPRPRRAALAPPHRRRPRREHRGRARRGRRRRPRRHDGLRRRGPGCRQPRPGAPRCPAPGRDRCRGRRGRVRRRQRLAFPGVPGAAPPRGGREVRLGGGGRPLGGHPRHVRPRVGRRGRHRALRCRGVAVRARRRVRAVPDLRQRALALRAAPRGRRRTAALPCTPTRRTIRGCSSDTTRRLGHWPPSPLVALISAGCGSNAPSETGTADQHRHRQQTATKRDKAVKFAECMREQRRPASSRTRTRRAS